MKNSLKTDDCAGEKDTFIHSKDELQLFAFLKGFSSKTKKKRKKRNVLRLKTNTKIKKVVKNRKIDVKKNQNDANRKQRGEDKNTDNK